MFVKQTFLDIFLFFLSFICNLQMYEDKLYLYLINVNVKDIANL